MHQKAMRSTLHSQRPGSSLRRCSKEPARHVGSLLHPAAALPSALRHLPRPPFLARPLPATAGLRRCGCLGGQLAEVLALEDAAQEVSGDLRGGGGAVDTLRASSRLHGSAQPPQLVLLVLLGVGCAHVGAIRRAG
jgi:hypothetical protein